MTKGAIVRPPLWVGKEISIVERLCVLYDERCGLCRWARQWALNQPAYIPLMFIPAGSDQAKGLFPGLDQGREPEELLAIGDGGEVYRNDSAWIMCLFALQDYREWANRLASPALRPLARQAFAFVSKRRGSISHWVGLADDTAISTTLKTIELPACELERSAALKTFAALNACKQNLQALRARSAGE